MRQVVGPDQWGMCMRVCVCVCVSVCMSVHIACVKYFNYFPFFIPFSLNNVSNKVPSILTILCEGHRHGVQGHMVVIVGMRRFMC